MLTMKYERKDFFGCYRYTEDSKENYSKEDVKKALFSMKSNRAPGPDNIPAEFYQHCWDIVKEDIMRLFTAFHAGELDISRLNYGIITLLPKINGANKEIKRSRRTA